MNNLKLSYLTLISFLIIKSTISRPTINELNKVSYKSCECPLFSFPMTENNEKICADIQTIAFAATSCSNEAEGIQIGHGPIYLDTNSHQLCEILCASSFYSCNESYKESIVNCLDTGSKLKKNILGGIISKELEVSHALQKMKSGAVGWLLEKLGLNSHDILLNTAFKIIFILVSGLVCVCIAKYLIASFVNIITKILEKLCKAES